MIRSNKNIKEDFETLLKKKFVDKAATYAFLDPFAGEFSYKNNKSFYKVHENLFKITK
jgi:hypothetical protein